MPDIGYGLDALGDVADVLQSGSPIVSEKVVSVTELSGKRTFERHTVPAPLALPGHNSRLVPFEAPYRCAGLT